MFHIKAAILLGLVASPLTQGLPASVLKARHLTDVHELKDSYDYIVIGGGTAGLTIGDRLSESNECEWGALEDLQNQTDGY